MLALMPGGHTRESKISHTGKLWEKPVMDLPTMKTMIDSASLPTQDAI